MFGAQIAGFGYFWNDWNAKNKPLSHQQIYKGDFRILPLSWRFGVLDRQLHVLPWFTRQLLRLVSTKNLRQTCCAQKKSLLLCPGIAQSLPVLKSRCNWFHKHNCFCASHWWGHIYPPIVLICSILSHNRLLFGYWCLLLHTIEIDPPKRSLSRQGRSGRIKLGGSIPPIQSDKYNYMGLKCRFKSWSVDFCVTLQNVHLNKSIWCHI